MLMLRNRTKVITPVRSQGTKTQFLPKLAHRYMPSATSKEQQTSSLVRMAKLGSSSV